MPYKIINLPNGQKYKVINVESKKDYGITTKSKAIKQERLLRAIEHGFVPSK